MTGGHPFSMPILFSLASTYQHQSPPSWPKGGGERAVIDIHFHCPKATKASGSAASCSSNPLARHLHYPLPATVGSYFLSFSSSCSLSFSRSMMLSWVSFRSPSSFRFARSRSIRTFFSCSRDPSSWRRKEKQTGVDNLRYTVHTYLLSSKLKVQWIGSQNQQSNSRKHQGFRDPD